MILGVGLDIVDVDAFAAQLADPASAFVEATFRPGERRGITRGMATSRGPGDGGPRPASRDGAGSRPASRGDGGPRSQPRGGAGVPPDESDAGPGAAGDGTAAVPFRRAQHLAGRFAAKEALVKAWSVARRGQPPALAQVDLRDVEVVDDGHGRPGLRLHGAVRDAVSDLAPGATVVAHVSISHDGPTAAAVVILET